MLSRWLGDLEPEISRRGDGTAEHVNEERSPRGADERHYDEVIELLQEGQRKDVERYVAMQKGILDPRGNTIEKQKQVFRCRGT